MPAVTLAAGAATDEKKRTSESHTRVPESSSVPEMIR